MRLTTAKRWIAARASGAARHDAEARRTASFTDEGGGIDQPPPVPEVPAGWRTGPPDFIGVGAQRCGTTRWFRLIAEHPRIANPNGAKELHYFDRFQYGGCTPEELERYQRYFPRPTGSKVGEWTPLYASAPWVPPLLAAAAPHARLLVVLRDPVERLRSGLGLAETVARRRGVPLSRYATLDAYARGLYHAQLVQLMHHFERSRVLVLQYERCALAPAEQLRRTYEFLEVDSDHLPSLEARPREQREKPTLDERSRQAYIDAYREDVVALCGQFGELDVALWPNFAHLA